MLRKAFAQVSVLVFILLAFLGTPLSARAGGMCGGTYIVDAGDTLDSIAAKCGTSVSAINSANPGISQYLYAGQALTVPGTNYNAQVISYIVDYNTYGTYGNYNYYAPVSYSGTYVVQYGDTFSGIASRYGVSINALWAANPYIWNINYLYAGQVIYVPSGQVYAYPPYSPVIVPTPTEPSTQLSYGTVPPGTPHGRVQLSNQANGDVYVSLQGTTKDGISVINEYPVGGSMNVKIPAGSYFYVAWVGGQKFTGSFHLGGDSDRSMTFYSNKVVVD